jgi:fructose-1,6-bisphosphatase/inositol monophosphatase family enzyme
MLFSTRDAATTGEILREAARAEILPRFRSLGEGQVRQKTGALDLVTDADEQAELRIAAALREAFPGCVIVGEESTEKDRSLLDRLADAELAFVVDPVDGTMNFACGLPLFGVMAAAIVRGEIVAGIIYDPMGDDFAVAVRGEGAWFERPDGSRRDIRVAAPAPVSHMVGGISWNSLAEPNRSILVGNMPKVATVFTYRCAAHEYRLVAAGNCHFLAYTKLMPWDHAAGWLLHQEAGGYSARFDGSPYRATLHDGGILCAPDRDSWEALHSALFQRHDR